MAHFGFLETIMILISLIERDFLSQLIKEVLAFKELLVRLQHHLLLSYIL
jgi:hypothetical protein